MNRLMVVATFLSALAHTADGRETLCGTYFERESEAYGYITCDGSRVSPAAYIFAHEFTAGGISANLLPGRGWRYINTAGEVLVEPYVFDNGPDYFVEGFSRFVEDGRIGFINESGQIVVDAKYEAAFPVEDGVARVGSGCEVVPVDEFREYTRWECSEWVSVAIPR